MRNILAAFVGLALCTANAAANESFDELKKMNIKMCAGAGMGADGKPTTPKLAESFCTCTTHAYWDSVPKAEVQELLTTGDSKRVTANVDKRWKAAEAVCKKKAGF